MRPANYAEVKFFCRIAAVAFAEIFNYTRNYVFSGRFRLVLSEGSAAHVIHPAATDKSNINKILALIIRCKITEYPPNVQNYTDSMFSKMGA